MSGRAPSRQVISNQSGTHEHLTDVVLKHQQHTWQKPISEFSSIGFTNIKQWLDESDKPLILDSGCGTGESSIRLAEQHPNHRILGFDRSEVRLDKLFRKFTLPENCLIVRADADDLWRQLVQHHTKVEKHYLLFPNPYPKASQLNKRWHGSPVFPWLVALGGQIELRSNWLTYLEEFRLAVSLITNQPVMTDPAAYTPDPPLTLFEKKYFENQQTLWRLELSLPTTKNQ